MILCMSWITYGAILNFCYVFAAKFSDGNIKVLKVMDLGTFFYALKLIL